MFCSTDDEDEEEGPDYSKFLEMKGNSRPVLFRFFRTLSWLGHFIGFSSNSSGAFALCLAFFPYVPFE